MRILYDVLGDGRAAVNTANRQLSEAQEQVSTGKRVSSAGDDPLAVQHAIGERTTLGALRPGDTVNIEIDAVAKMVVRTAERMQASGGGNAEIEIVRL